MEKLIEIHWTSGSIDEARKISRYLVQERLVACVQIIPWVESIYLWDNQLETAQETKIVIKTLAQHFDKVREIIEQNCKYEIPEILHFAIEGGNASYLEWVQEQCVKPVF